METITYISVATPFIIGFILMILKLKEVTKKNKEYRAKEKNNSFFTEDAMRKDKLKIPGYYEDFFTSDKEDHIASVNRFMNGGTWV